ncbi:MAG: ChaN family lipoprotein [Aureispira sp.]|nr:ChaN family lipoprotein [Aureispira sp.]
MRFVFLMVLSICTTMVIAQENPQAYKIFNHKGKEVSYVKMTKELQKGNIIFFGELHNNPIGHWLQLELTRDLYVQMGENLVLGAEMFESDNQIVVNEYFLGYISEKSFEKEARLWPNYSTDYKPLVEFSKENGLRFVATNVPRRYASMVFKQGLKKLNELPDYSKIFMAPLPIQEDYDLDCYKAMLEMSTGHNSKGDKKYPQAQMLKDATMAHFIFNNWSEGETFLHFNGSFHSDNKEGIVWYLRQNDPELNIINITTVEQDQLNKLEREHYQKADFIIVVPSRMTKTY